MVLTRSAAKDLDRVPEMELGLATPSSSTSSASTRKDLTPSKQPRRKRRQHTPTPTPSQAILASGLGIKRRRRVSASSSDFYFSVLPLHIQKEILELLPWRDRVKLEKVCRIWLHLLRGAWRDVTSLDIPTTITDKFGMRPIDDQQVCGFLRKCGAWVGRIDFFFLHQHIADHVLFSVRQRCGSLRELLLTTDIPGKSMSLLLKKYCHTIAPALREFSLSYHNESDRIHNGLRAALRQMTSLQGFRLDTFYMPPNVATLFPASGEMRRYALLLLQPGTVDQNRWKYVSPSFLLHFFQYLTDVYPSLEELDISLDTDVAIDEMELYRYLKKLGQTRAIFRLNLRISYLFEDYDVWFGALAIPAIKFFSRMTDLALWSCILPPGILDVMDEGDLGSRLLKLRLSIVRGLNHEVLSALLGRCQSLQLFSLIYSAEDHFTCPRSITARTLLPLFSARHRAPIRTLELMDCDSVDLKDLILRAHAASHAPPLSPAPSSPLPPPPPGDAPEKLEVTYKTNLKLRLRHLAEGRLCCVNVYKKRNTVFKVDMARVCKETIYH